MMYEISFMDMGKVGMKALLKQRKITLAEMKSQVDRLRKQNNNLKKVIF